MTDVHHGSCHCGAVRYRVRTTLDTLASCNCSICSRVGWLLAFVPSEDFTLEAGDDHLADYQFGHRQAHHVFCRTCGVRSFSRGSMGGKEMVAVNVRCLEGVDLRGHPVKEFDGKSL